MFDGIRWHENVASRNFTQFIGDWLAHRMVHTRHSYSKDIEHDDVNPNVEGKAGGDVLQNGEDGGIYCDDDKEASHVEDVKESNGLEHAHETKNNKKVQGMLLLIICRTVNENRRQMKGEGLNLLSPVSVHTSKIMNQIDLFLLI